MGSSLLARNNKRSNVYFFSNAHRTDLRRETSAAVERNLRDIESVAARLEILPYDTGAAIHTGQLRAELRKIGCPIGPYDEMIAGHARSQGLVIVTNNIWQFKHTAGVRLVNWVTR